MKNILILVIFISTCFFSSAQNKTVSSDIVYSCLGATSDTVVKDGTHTYGVYVSNFANVVKIQATATRTRGTYTKARVILQKSMDYSNWTAIDTISFAGTSTTYSSVSDIVYPISPYFRILSKPYDSTQTVKIGYIILIDKN